MFKDAYRKQEVIPYITKLTLLRRALSILKNIQVGNYYLVRNNSCLVLVSNLDEKALLNSECIFLPQIYFNGLKGRLNTSESNVKRVLSQNLNKLEVDTIPNPLYLLDKKGHIDEINDISIPLFAMRLKLLNAEKK